MISKKRIIPVFFILILSSFPTMPFVYSAGYGEENESLGQFTDDYENDDNVSIAVNVINNQTLDCMELNTSVGDGWWNGSFQKRQRHYFDQDPVKGFNYTVKIRIYAGDGVSSGSNMYCNNSVRDDFGDIRFHDSVNDVELGYWIKEDDFTSGNNALFFIRLDSLNISLAEQSIDVYYNCSLAITTSNIYNAVLIGDDFNYTGSINPTYWNNYTYDQDPNFESVSIVDGDQLHCDLYDSVGPDDLDGFYFVSKHEVDDLVGWEFYSEGSWSGADWFRGGAEIVFAGVNDTDNHKTGFEIRMSGDSGARTGQYDDDVFVWYTDIVENAAGTWSHFMEHNESDGTFDDWDFTSTIAENDDNDATAGINNPIKIEISNYLHSWGGGGATSIDVYTDYIYLIKYSDRGQKDGSWTYQETSIGYASDGYFITEDYLNYTTGQSLALLTNASIPGSTSITVEFSEDSTTWVDNEGNVGANTLEAGFFALDLRDLNYADCFIRYNFSGPGSSTPRLFQSRLITTEGPGIINITLGAYHIFNASSISIIVGTLNDGNLASTYFVDNDWYNVSEENAIPGLDVRFNFTGIEENVTCGCIEVFQTYTGHSQHEMYIQAWNFSDSSWDTLGSFIYNETAGWVCVGLGHNPEHFFNNGNMFARFYHGDQGHLAHEIHVERIDLRIVYGEECEDGDIIIESDFPWIAIAIILSIIAGLLVWMKFGNQ